MTDLIVKRKSKLSQSPNQKDDIYQEINEKSVFRVFFFFLKSTRSELYIWKGQGMRLLPNVLGLPRWLSSRESVCQHGRLRVNP